jgi:hypothetical protein
MPNAIKYSTTTQSLALKKGNYYIATGDVDKGGQVNYWNGITPPTNGYTIYLNKESNGPSIYVVSSDSELISLTKIISGQNLTTVNECLSYFNGQTDKFVLNNDIPPITTNGLVINLDASTVISYPRSGSTWNDVSLSGNNFTLLNGVSYSANTLVFDGSDDYASITTNNSVSNLYQKSFTVEIFVYVNSSASTSNTYQTFVHIGGNDYPFFIGGLRSGLTGVAGLYCLFGGVANFITTPFGSYVYGGTTYTYPGKWTHIMFVADYTNNYTKTYINGSYYTGTTYNGTMSNQNNNFWLGRTNGYNEYLSGNFSAFRMYNRALTESEISLNYESTVKKYSSLEVQYLVVAGGGSGGQGFYPSGGGGAGGLLTGYSSTLSMNTNYTITVGAGGSVTSNGSNSVFNTFTSIGGGRGGNGRSGVGISGGSGGGGGSNYPLDGNLVNYLTLAGLGTIGQGNDGGVGKSVYNDTRLNGVPTGAGGGGGAGGVGGTGTTTPSIKAGNGGVGLYFSEYVSLGGTPSGWFAGGGGGSTSYSNNSNSAIGIGGSGGGGNGSATSFSNSGLQSTPGVINTGGGGGGGGYGDSPAAAGGSGIVILRVPDVYNAVFSSGVVWSVTKSNRYKYYKVTATSTTSETVYFY